MPSSLQGADKFRARLKAIGRTEVLMRDISIHGVAEAKRIVPRKTSNLGRTIRVGDVNARQAEIKAGGQMKVGYARYVEEGTKPHIIRPVRRKALAWGGPRTLGGRLRVSGGVTARPTHFAKVVHHPGTRAHPYLVPGLQKAAKEQGVKSLVKLWNDAA